MIRLRIDRSVSEKIGLDKQLRIDGLIWYESGLPMGRVIIERAEPDGFKQLDGFEREICYKWVPVEVVES